VQNREAIPYYKKAITLDSHIPIYECNLGLTFGNLGQWEKAIEHYTRAVELRRKAPTDPYGLDYYYDYLAEGYFKDGRFKEAEKIYLRILELQPNNAEYQDKIGFVYSQLGDYNKAADHFQKAVVLRPDSQVYISDLIKISEKIANPVARKSLLESTLRYVPENIELKQALENLKQ
jgi:tetratricopeptide (TPR) repeat protein